MDASRLALPPEALARVLSFIPFEQRLRNCAVVYRAWARAAGLAMPSIPCAETEVLHLTVARARSLGTWLHKHGGSAVHVAVATTSDTAKVEYSAGGGMPLECTDFQFPWAYQLPQLQSLTLAGFKLLPSSSSDPSSSIAGRLRLRRSGSLAPAASATLAAAPGPLAGLTALTSLSLQTCLASLALGSGFSNLAALSGLRALELGSCDLHPQRTSGAAVQQHMAALNSALLQLQQLTSLVVSKMGVDASVLSGLSGLRELQRFEFKGHCAGNKDIVSLGVLPTQLTSVSLTGNWQFSSGRLSRTVNFTHLHEFVLYGVEVFQPSVLGRMPQLRSLRLASVRALSPAHAAGVRALLAVMPKLQQLQALSFSSMLHVCRSSAAAALQYTALVSTSCLTSLNLAAFPVTDEALTHMLAGNMQLPLLQQLHLHLGQISQNLPGDRSYGEQFYPPFDVGDLCRLALCCPALQDVSTLMIAAAEEPAELAAAAASLQQLTTLTRLVVGGDRITTTNFA